MATIRCRSYGASVNLGWRYSINIRLLRSWFTSIDVQPTRLRQSMNVKIIERLPVMGLNSPRPSDLADPNPFVSIPLKQTRYALQDLCSDVLFAWDVLKHDPDTSRSGRRLHRGFDWRAAD